MSITATTTDINVALHRELLRLARAEDDKAANDAATVPYWSPCPPSVHGHRTAAAILRAEADLLDAC